MKGIVNTYLNERIQQPNLSSESKVYYEPGDELEIVDILNGDVYENNNVWYELENGSYVWSGGVDGNKDILPQKPGNSHKEQIADITEEGFDLRKSWRLIGFDGFKGDYGSDVLVGVIDSGYNAHNDIEPNRIDGFNLRKTNDDGSYSTDISDHIGHGTSMSGLIAAQGAMIGIAPNCSISMLKIFEQKENEQEGLKMIPDAILTAIKQNVNIISLSLETSILSKELSHAIDTAIKKNIIIVGSIGTNSTRVKYPGLHSAVIGVGNCWIDENLNLQPLEWSGRGIGISCVAPGVEVKSLSNLVYDSYQKCTGPSVSVAIVSGVIASVLSEFTEVDRKNITPGLMKTWIENSSTKAGFTEYNSKLGHGLINPSGLLVTIRNELTTRNREVV